MSKPETTAATNFLRPIVQADLESGKHAKIVTRFPPEPNGYLHIGHAKSICLNFGLAKEFGGECNLRFDDTNPAKEDQEYIDAIKSDVQWLGFQWAGEERYASNYFAQLHAWAIELIKAGKAYVCDLTPDQAREYRGSLTEPGKNSPFRDRSVEENLDLFARMKAGEFPDGAKALRAKIDMASPNMNMRDPILYRIRHAHHHQTGNDWCIYPSYDFTHGQSDAIEGITHSICTLEFEDHRPLYDWFLENLPVPARPRQYEFARLNLNYTITSKRKLKQLVDEKHVSGWDDPRMSTLSGYRRRGYTPASIRTFCDMIGVNRAGRKVKGVIHWVPAAESVECEVRLYDRLFRSANPEKDEEGGSFLDNINPESLVVLTGCRAEPSLAQAVPEERFQFEREGYFCADIKDSKPGAPVFNRTVTLRDSWA